VSFTVSNPKIVTMDDTLNKAIEISIPASLEGVKPLIGTEITLQIVVDDSEMDPFPIAKVDVVTSTWQLTSTQITINDV
jgi:hypothetical protein